MREKLTAEFCVETQDAGYYADGGGLYLIVKPDGRKYWCFRWRDRKSRYSTPKSAGVGKLREKGLGRYGDYDVSLQEARELAGVCRQQLRRGEDPIEQARLASSRAISAQIAAPTFGECAERYVELHKTAWSSEKQAQQWLSSLQRHAASLLVLPVSAIDAGQVRKCLEPIWHTHTETATRVRQRIESVLDWAAASKYRNPENPAEWQGNLDQFLQQPAQIRAGKPSRTFLDYQRMGEFMRKLGSKDSLAARALEIQILTVTRPGDVVTARWSEFGLKGKVWQIPAERFRTGHEHRIPLSSQVINILKNIPQVSDFVFPGRLKNSAMTTAAGMKLLKSLHPGITQQGFRSTFRDWARNETNYPRDVISHALAPPSGDEAEAAYLRSDLIAKRTALMRDWADFCEKA